MMLASQALRRAAAMDIGVPSEYSAAGAVGSPVRMPYGMCTTAPLVDLLDDPVKRAPLTRSTTAAASTMQRLRSEVLLSAIWLLAGGAAMCTGGRGSIGAPHEPVLVGARDEAVSYVVHAVGGDENRGGRL